MEFTNRTSTAQSPDELIKDLTQTLTGPFDLGIVFFSQTSYTDIKKIIIDLKKRLAVTHLIGCTSAGIIGSEQEVEFRPAVSLTLCKLPGVKVTPFSLNQIQLDKLQNKKELYEYLEVFPNENPVFICFPDPFLFDMNFFLNSLNEAYPKCPVLGGIASAGMQAHSNVLIVNDDYYSEGAIGLVLTGNLKVETVVSQGCRPIGETFIVTKCQENIIFELAGKSFLKVLEEVVKNIDDRDRGLVQEAIFVGIAMDEYKFPYKRGDFLIRGLMGIDQQNGAGAIGDYIRNGQTIQFHVRDALSATEDLNELLSQQQNKNNNIKPKGALIFSCNGRGINLFKQNNHDINIFQKYMGPVATGGFFCAGEIGPVGGFNFLHGFTDSIALFYPAKNN